MATAALVVSAIGTAATVVSSMQAAQASQEQGAAQQAEAQYQAQQLKSQAQTVQGEADQKAQQDQLQAAYILSTQASDASANGSGGTTDPSTANIMSKTAARGQYQSLNDIWGGQAQAAGIQNQSQADIYQGQQQAQAGEMAATAKEVGGIGTAFSNAGSLYAKYAVGTSPYATADESTDFSTT
jgi:hypothetical protein